MPKIAPDIRWNITIDSGDDDAYGWALNHWFDIAETLYATEAAIPSDWTYHNPWSRQHTLTRLLNPSDGPENEMFELAREGLATHPDLTHAGNVLGRYMRRLNHLGRGLD